MSDTPRNTPPLRFNWWRFCAFAAGTTALLGTVAVLKLGRHPDPALAAFVGVFVLSLVGFMAFRWHLLRQAAASGALTPQMFYSNLKTYLRGPTLHYVVWLILTFFATVGTLLIVAKVQ